MSFEKSFIPVWIVLGVMIAMSFAQSLKAWDENGNVACLAEAIYFESGNQSDAGRLAVGHVILNRVEMKEYPDTICDVVQQGQYKQNWKGNYVPVLHKCQFSYYCD